MRTLHAPAYALKKILVPNGGDAAMSVVLQRENESPFLITGRVVLEGGSPAIGAHVSTGGMAVLTDERRGIEYIHVLQPTLTDEGSKEVSPDEALILAGGREGTCVREGYPHLRRLGEDLVEEGVEFRDATGTFKGMTERIYRDACHYNRIGNTVLAEALLKPLLEALTRAAGSR